MNWPLHCGARTHACRIDTRVDAWLEYTNTVRRDESRRGTHECVRHVAQPMAIKELVRDLTSKWG